MIEVGEQLRAIDPAVADADGLIRSARAKLAAAQRAARLVFLCHSSGDKERVRQLYHQLMADGVDCWFDEERILPGQYWITWSIVHVNAKDHANGKDQSMQITRRLCARQVRHRRLSKRPSRTPGGPQASCVRRAPQQGCRR